MSEEGIDTLRRKEENDELLDEHGRDVLSLLRRSPKLVNAMKETAGSRDLGSKDIGWERGEEVMAVNQCWMGGGGKEALTFSRERERIPSCQRGVLYG